MVKIQIYMTFTPRRGENSDLHDIFTTLWWKFRFTRHFHHTVVKIQIYTTFSPHREGFWRFGDNPLRIDWNIDENV